MHGPAAVIEAQRRSRQGYRAERSVIHFYQQAL